MPVHRLRGVGREVDHDLLKLGRVAQDRGILRLESLVRIAIVAGSEARSRSTVSSITGCTRVGRRSCSPRRLKARI